MMDDDRRNVLPAERLPPLRLPSAPGGGLVPLVPPGGRGVPIIVGVDGADCEACRAYVQQLADAEAALREWDARVAIVVPGGLPDANRFAAAAGAPFPVLADERRALWARMGADGAAAVFVADPWGELRFRHAAGPDHDLPSPAELADWARFVAIQCPECEGEAW